MKKKKIAFIINKLGSGGAERVVTTLANKLAENYSVQIITFSQKESFYKLKKEIEIVPCFVETSPSKNFLEALKFNYSLIKRIQIILKTNEINLLISFMTSANVLATIAAKLSKVPVIISERNNPYKKQTTSFWKLLRQITYPYANHLIVQTSAIRDFYLKKINNKKLHVIPNPISKELTQKRKINSLKKNIILNVGSLTDQKAQDMLVMAFARTQNKNWQLVIAGEGPNRKKLNILIEKLGLEHQVLLSGRIKDVSEMYNISKIFAFSSLYEGFPNALIEAMHFGLPCVSTDCPTGPSELIVNDFNGYLVPVNDQILMSEKLQLLMDDKEKRDIIGNLALKSVKKYEIESVILDWVNLLEKCLS